MFSLLLCIAVCVLVRIIRSLSELVESPDLCDNLQNNNVLIMCGKNSVVKWMNVGKVFHLFDVYHTTDTVFPVMLHAEDPTVNISLPQ